MDHLCQSWEELPWKDEFQCRRNHLWFFLWLIFIMESLYVSMRSFEELRSSNGINDVETCYNKSRVDLEKEKDGMLHKQ